jgi:hypothetical protein
MNVDRYRVSSGVVQSGSVVIVQVLSSTSTSKVNEEGRPAAEPKVN